MATKTSNVIARVEPEIKEKAEAILSQLGITASGGINMFYRQIIHSNGLPFRPSIPWTAPKSLSEMSREELDAKLARGIEEVAAGEGMPANDFFELLEQEIAADYV